MEANRVNEYFGVIIKVETLVSLEDKVMPNTFVLEAPEPFPGYYQYYHEHPVMHKPQYVYLVLDREYSLEQITRATQNISSYSPTLFDATPGTIYLYNEAFPVIRLRHFESYDKVYDLQSAYMDEGIRMHKAYRKNIQDEATIRLRKFFTLEQKAENVFFDIHEKDHAYFLIPKQLKWKSFESLTMIVKSNWNKTIFDAAVGYFYINSKIHDMVRIYDPSLNIADIESIAKKYLERIK